jgi:hypothetical protein
MTFKEKIDKILEINNLKIESVSALEDFVGAGRSAINDFYNENREPGRKTLKKIKSLPGLNLEWYDTGKGPVFLKNGTPDINIDEQPVIREQKKDPAVDDRILKKLDSLTDNVNAFGDFNRFLLKEIDRLHKKIIDLGGEI